MVVFVWTVVIGILNGTDIVDFSRKTVLSHVHAGTLGWITMCVFAASLWLFGATATRGQVRAARALVLAAIITLPAFALTFAITYAEGRAVMGSFAFASIVGFFAWVLWRLRSVEVTTVHLGFLAAVATSVAGGAIGVLLATKIATGRNVLPSGGEDAHPATMVVGFLIPVGMALAEWALGWPTLRKASRLGTAQMALPFIGGILLMLSLLLEIEPLAPIAALIEFAGVVIFVIRHFGAAKRVDWKTPTPARYAVAAGVAIVANILFINYLAGRHKGDFDNVPTEQLLALDHMMFIGVLTNAIFGLLLVVARRDGRGRIADQAVFFGMNIGLVGFVVSLLGDLTWLERASTPLMGASILTGLAVYTMRLASREATESFPVVVAEAATP
ncbi:MAG: hypothetical protein C0506_03715 [Anaerolinea sp.]|nr:hypothetical protein [Anaerolinea sp.]